MSDSEEVFKKPDELSKDGPPENYTPQSISSRFTQVTSLLSPRIQSVSAKLLEQGTKLKGHTVYRPFSGSASQGATVAEPTVNGDLTSLIDRFHEQGETIKALQSQIRDEKDAMEAHKAAIQSRASEQRIQLGEQRESLQALEKEIAAQENRSVELHSQISSLRSRQTALEGQLRRQKLLQLELLPERMQYRQAKSEIFVWRVPGVSQLRIANKEMYSEPFLSQMFHYSFRIKLRFNGVASLNEGSLSAGLNLTQGPSDEEATWPFNLAFTLRLVDLMGNVVESATISALNESADTVSVAFERPAAGNELSRGWGNFVTWADHDEADILPHDSLHLEMVFDSSSVA